MSLVRQAKLEPQRTELLLMAGYKITYVTVIIAAPLLLASSSSSCKSSPHYAAHLIFLGIQLILVALSTFLHKK
jgi:hypothetical protein